MTQLQAFYLLLQHSRWQDVAIALGNIYFCFTLIPMCRDSGKPPLSSSLSTRLALLAGSCVFATLNLWLIALTQAVTGTQWLYLTYQKWMQLRVTRRILKRNAYSVP